MTSSCFHKYGIFLLTLLIPDCCVLCTSSILKTFVIRSFFFKKWLLTHVLGGAQGHKSSCKHACVAFLTFFPWYHHKVRDKRYFDPDTELLRTLHFRNSKNIRNPLIFLPKMASYSCFWRVPSSKILLQASLHRIYDLLTLVSSSKYVCPTSY